MPQDVDIDKEERSAAFVALFEDCASAGVGKAKIWRESVNGYQLARGWFAARDLLESSGELVEGNPSCAWAEFPPQDRSGWSRKQLFRERPEDVRGASTGKITGPTPADVEQIMLAELAEANPLPPPPAKETSDGSAPSSGSGVLVVCESGEVLRVLARALDFRTLDTGVNRKDERTMAEATAILEAKRKGYRVAVSEPNPDLGTTCYAARVEGIFRGSKPTRITLVAPSKDSEFRRGVAQQETRDVKNGGGATGCSASTPAAEGSSSLEGIRSIFDTQTRKDEITKQAELHAAIRSFSSGTVLGRPRRGWDGRVEQCLQEVRELFADHATAVFWMDPDLVGDGIAVELCKQLCECNRSSSLRPGGQTECLRATSRAIGGAEQLARHAFRTAKPIADLQARGDACVVRSAVQLLAREAFGNLAQHFVAGENRSYVFKQKEQLVAVAHEMGFPELTALKKTCQPPEQIDTDSNGAIFELQSEEFPGVVFKCNAATVTTDQPGLLDRRSQDEGAPPKRVSGVGSVWKVSSSQMELPQPPPLKPTELLKIAAWHGITPARTLDAARRLFRCGLVSFPLETAGAGGLSAINPTAPIALLTTGNQEFQFRIETYQNTKQQLENEDDRAILDIVERYHTASTLTPTSGRGGSVEIKYRRERMQAETPGVFKDNRRHERDRERSARLAVWHGIQCVVQKDAYDLAKLVPEYVEEQCPGLISSISAIRQLPREQQLDVESAYATTTDMREFLFSAPDSHFSRAKSLRSCSIRFVEPVASFPTDADLLAHFVEKAVPAVDNDTDDADQNAPGPDAQGEDGSPREVARTPAALESDKRDLLPITVAGAVANMVSCGILEPVATQTAKRSRAAASSIAAPHLLEPRRLGPTLLGRELYSVIEALESDAAPIFITNASFTTFVEDTARRVATGAATLENVLKTGSGNPELLDKRDDLPADQKPPPSNLAWFIRHRFEVAAEKLAAIARGEIKPVAPDGRRKPAPFAEKGAHSPRRESRHRAAAGRRGTRTREDARGSRSRSRSRIRARSQSRPKRDRDRRRSPSKIRGRSVKRDVGRGRDRSRSRRPQERHRSKDKESRARRVDDRREPAKANRPSSTKRDTAARGKSTRKRVSKSRARPARDVRSRSRDRQDHRLPPADEKARATAATTVEADPKIARRDERPEVLIGKIAGAIAKTKKRQQSASRFRGAPPPPPPPPPPLAEESAPSAAPVLSRTAKNLSPAKDASTRATSTTQDRRAGVNMPSSSASESSAELDRRKRARKSVFGPRIDENNKDYEEGAAAAELDAGDFTSTLMRRSAVPAPPPLELINTKTKLNNYSISNDKTVEQQKRSDALPDVGDPTAKRRNKAETQQASSSSSSGGKNYHIDNRAVYNNPRFGAPSSTFDMVQQVNPYGAAASSSSVAMMNSADPMSMMMMQQQYGGGYGYGVPAVPISAAEMAAHHAAQAAFWETLTKLQGGQEAEGTNSSGGGQCGRNSKRQKKS
ncbi:unnamed protein product [Amoebophrya sp. A120]|nr:unnamed protein product [Amoebophrya sp. A120]|eukprot:GSA120T00018413001.1